MPEVSEIYTAAISLAAAAAILLFLVCALAMRRSRGSRRRENRLSTAFDRARDMRKHGSSPVGSRYGVFEDRIRRSGAFR